MTDEILPEFDAFAANYDKELNKGLALSGETKEYFAEGRAHWLRSCLNEVGWKDGSRGLDFGCGIGAGTPYLMEGLGLSALVGADPSEESLRIAEAEHGSDRVRFLSTTALPGEAGSFDIAFCNGVFHHIPLVDRNAAAASVFESLKPGGFFAFWENNPWNPMVHYIMSKVPFDSDAIMLWPGEARKLLKQVGFEIVRTDFRFIFPGALAALRFMEPALAKTPLGGQYQILCSKPE
jgi:SAM-dependent methyltransferase